MSDKLKHTRTAAVAVAEELCDGLKMVTTRLIVAGSLRRQFRQVGDVEILYSPLMVTAQVDMFDSPDLVSAVEGHLDALVRAGVLRPRPAKTGISTWGPLNKLAVHVQSGIPVDFFCEPDEANWARSVVFRTGPTAMNIKLIETAARKGIRVHAYGPALTRLTTGEVIPCKTEEEFFEICGVPYLDPQERQ